MFTHETGLCDPRRGNAGNSDSERDNILLNKSKASRALGEKRWIRLHTLILTNNKIVNLVETDPLSSIPKLSYLSDTRRSSTIGPITRGMAKKLQDEYSSQGQVLFVIFGWKLGDQGDDTNVPKHGER